MPNEDLVKAKNKGNYPILLAAFVLFLGMLLAAQVAPENLTGYSTANLQGQSLRAFPEAEGFGANSLGGRGPGSPAPQIIAVTNLNDSGPGSLRAAVEASGPRFVVFRVSGVIFLNSPLVISNPYITIAGQTAPTPGITLAHFGIKIIANEVVIRYIRSRIYYDSATEDPVEGSIMDGVEIWADNVILDHMSLSWAIDEMLDVENVGPYIAGNYTVQWSIISEGATYGHAWGPQASGAFLTSVSANGSLHHNILAHNFDRSPLISRGGTYDFRNNVIYNWWHNAASHFGTYGPLTANIVGNKYIAGRDSFNSGGYVIRVRPVAEGNLPQLYLEDNRSPYRTSSSQDEWTLGVSDGSRIFTPLELAPYKSNSPIFVPAVTTQPVDEAFNLVLNQAGVNFPSRDTVDSELASEIRNSPGTRSYGPHHGPTRQVLWLQPQSGNILLQGPGCGSNCYFKPQMLLQSGEGDSPVTRERLLRGIQGVPVPPPPPDTARPLTEEEIQAVLADTSGRYVWIVENRVVPDAATINGLYPSNTNPTLPSDMDNDSVPDLWEAYLGSNPNLADSVQDADGDGYLNIEEYLNGLMTFSPPPPSVCGNGTINTGESCDDGNTRGSDGCSPSCGTEAQWVCTGEPSACTRAAFCGNNLIEASELCDGSALNNATCVSQGFDSGTLRCNSNCAFDTSACTAEEDTPRSAPPTPTCGDGVCQTENSETNVSCPADCTVFGVPASQTQTLANPPFGVAPQDTNTESSDFNLANPLGFISNMHLQPLDMALIGIGALLVLWFFLQSLLFFWKPPGSGQPKKGIP